MAQDSDMNAKLDKILEKIERLDKKMDSVEAKMDSRLSKVEEQCTILTKKSYKLDKCQQLVLSEVNKLKVRVNVMEQGQLKNNIIIRGVKEVENDANDLEFMVDSILSLLTTEFESHQLKAVRRIGMKKPNLPRLILAEIVNADAKLKIMKTLKDKKIDCGQFKTDGAVWGASNEKIHLHDQLTRFSNNIFYAARQLMKLNKVKYAWTKLGKVYVKRDDESKAFLVECLEQLAQFDKKLPLEEVVSESELETESEKATEDDVVSQQSSQQSKRRMDQSLSPVDKAPKRSPRPKRIKNKQK